MTAPSYSPDALFALRDQPIPYPGTKKGRGIVISAGGPLLPSAYIAVSSLRHHGSTLPIQVWHLGPAEMVPALRQPFEKLGVEFVDSFAVAREHPVRKLGGWENKPFMLLHSPFQEVLLLDADNMVLANPDPLFSAEPYAVSGVLLWPDFPAKEGDFWGLKPGAWELLGLTPRPGFPCAESGQLMIDKARYWKELVLALHMNEHSDFYYERLFFGDKDTYPFGFFVAGSEPVFAPMPPKMTIPPVRLQYAPDGRAMFQHSRKWQFPAGNNRKAAGFLDEELCFDWLVRLEKELRQQKLF